MTQKITATVVWDQIHPTVRSIMSNANITAVTGIVTRFNKSGRVEITFTHDNNANKCNRKFWFDIDQVEINEQVA